MVPSLPLLSCGSSIFVEENPDRKKKEKQLNFSHFFDSTNSKSPIPYKKVLHENNSAFKASDCFFVYSIFSFNWAYISFLAVNPSKCWIDVSFEWLTYNCECCFTNLLSV